ncbi:inactive protein RESTRICTED TEV MOVEMENT 2-like [Olea europaea var. sylvestris]|uniref:inactive protein RESTRICTED TEV MOVEMENT 2-like n=1 Tax=Olea europaea var. sylvestris TaxID=158386 RepID=UPI000C1CE014|nr:inactive protein RESTRICTED TEV MOVEMENT 2-like [Olea europaea var. sylvestris]
MATPRPRRGGATGPTRPRTFGVRPVYEDFKPVSEWSQDNDTYILTIQVPGFMKDQLKVSTVDQNFIRVRGERLVAGNKWSRFQEDFQVPDNSELTSVRTKHGGGTLIVTVPRKNVAGKTLATKKEENKTSQASLSPPPKAHDQVLPPETTGMESPGEPNPDQQSQVKVTPTASTSKPITDDKSLKPAPGVRKTSGDHLITKIGRQEDEQKNHVEKEKSPEMTEKPAAHESIVDKAGKKIVDDKSLELPRIKRTSGDHLSTRTGQQEDEQKRYIEKKGIQETKEKHFTPENASSKDNIGKGKEISPEDNKIISEKQSSAVHDSPDHDLDAVKLELKKQKKKSVKGLGELNGERQLLVNMGAALLVIVGLSAYVSYKFASQNDKH